MRTLLRLSSLLSSATLLAGLLGACELDIQPADSAGEDINEDPPPGVCDPNSAMDPDCWDGVCDPMNVEADPDCWQPPAETGDPGDTCPPGDPACVDNVCDPMNPADPDCPVGDGWCDAEVMSDPDCGDGLCNPMNPADPDCAPQPCPDPNLPGCGGDGVCSMDPADPDCQICGDANPCPEGQVCINGMCGGGGDGWCDDKVMDDPDCGDGLCNPMNPEDPDCLGDGVCDPMLPWDPDCLGDGVCTMDPADPDCQLQCMADDNCPEGQACVDGLCQCDPDLFDCGDGWCDPMLPFDPDCQACQPGDPNCSDGVCSMDPADPDCPLACMVDADCGPAQVCVDNLCTCAGPNCPDNVCDPMNPNDPDCPPAMCTKNADCAPNQKCVMGLCL